MKLALVQMRVDGGQREANLRRAAERLATAAAGGAEVALLPEALDLGWTDPEAAALASPIPDGAAATALRGAAANHGIWVVAGITEAAEETVFNSAVVIDPSGEIRLLHRKLNELPIGHGCYAQGDRLGTCATPWGRLGVMICADAFARGEVIARSLGYMGADFILSPSAWCVPRGHDQETEPYGALWRRVYGTVARDFGLWIAGVSNVGTVRGGAWAGRLCIGCSLVVGPDGEPAHQAPYGVDADVVEVVDLVPQPRPARGTGWAAHWGATE